jgi:beta-alanine--pyruvate transaminase
VPMGGVIVRKHVYDAFMNGPEHAIELFHGYTYSGHPLACAAALATLDLYRDERLFERAKKIEPKWYDAIMGLKGLPNVVDIRCVGLTGAIDLAPIAGSPGERVYRALEHSFHNAGVMIRPAGDTIELTPPLIVSENEIGEIMEKVGASIKAAA